MSYFVGVVFGALIIYQQFQIANLKESNKRLCELIMEEMNSRVTEMDMVARALEAIRVRLDR